MLLLLREQEGRDRGASITLQLGSLRCLESGRRKQSLHSFEMNALSTAKLTVLSVHLDHTAANIGKALTKVAKQEAKLPGAMPPPPHPQQNQIGGKSDGWETETSKNKKQEGNPKHRHLPANLTGCCILRLQSQDGMNGPPTPHPFPISAFSYTSSLFPSPLNSLLPA